MQSERTPLLKPDGGSKRVSTRDLVWILCGLWTPVFLGSLDGTIVATLLSPIGSYFNKANQSSYLGTSYLLSVAACTPLYGRLSDIMGRKGAMLMGLTLFSAGTLFCGLAPSMESLIAARAIAGMGGGGIMTVSSIAVTDLVPLKERGLYQGLANIVFGLGSGLGGPLGGWINDTLGWRWAFLIQIPLMVIAFFIISWKVNIPLPPGVRESSLREKMRRIDYLGALSLVAFVGCFLLPLALKNTEELPWNHPLIWGLFAASAVALIGFVLAESKWSEYPVLPLRLIRQRTPLSVALTNFFGSVVSFSMLYNIPMYFVAVRLTSATQSGLHLLPNSVALSLGSIFAGTVMRTTGKYWYLIVSSGVLLVGSSVLVSFWNDNTDTFQLWFDIVPTGFGFCSILTGTLIAMVASVDRADMAVATGITYLFRTVGQVLGVSLSGTIIQGVLVRELRGRITGPNSEELINKIRHSTDVIRTLDPKTQHDAVESYKAALFMAFISQVVFGALCLLSSLFIKEYPLPSTLDPPAKPRNENDPEPNGVED